jgi:hypothetical protein
MFLWDISSQRTFFARQLIKQAIHFTLVTRYARAGMMSATWRDHATVDRDLGMIPDYRIFLDGARRPW